MTRRSHLESLRQNCPAILPSLLLCDFGNLEREVERLKEAGIHTLHLDVMDGHFVPNLSYGMPIVEAVRKLTDMTIDVHLMISQPERYISQFHKAGADILTIHVEATDQPAALLKEIRSLGMGAGIALNPNTPLTSIENCLDDADLVLAMSVQAGFGGQVFNPVALEKLARLRELTHGRCLLEVDGGVNQDTIQDCAEAGANLFVIGSAIFLAKNYVAATQQLLELATVAK